MSEVNFWSTTAASNNAAPPDGAPEGTTPLSSLNNIIREVMRSVKAWQADTEGSLTSTNVGNAYSVSLNRTGVSSLYNGLRLSFLVNSANISPAPTLNVNGLGAKAVKYPDGTDIGIGDWSVNQVVDVTYVSALGYFKTPFLKVDITSSIAAAKLEVLQTVYRVGSVFATEEPANPATYLGFGTFSAYGQGRVLIGAGSGTDSRGETISFSATATGGEYKHVLSTSEMPSHSHSMTTANAAGEGETVERSLTGSVSEAELSTGSTGGGQPHNNTQPYIVVYYWKRTA